MFALVAANSGGSSLSTAFITDKIRRAFMHAGIEHRQHIRMIQRRQRLGFLLETPQPIRIGHEVLGQHLHCHVAIQSRVPRAEHFAHAARAERRGDLILVE